MKKKIVVKKKNPQIADQIMGAMFLRFLADLGLDEETLRFIKRLIRNGCPVEAIEKTLHLGVVDPLKDALTVAQADAAKLPDVQKKLDELEAAENGGKDSWKGKYEALKTEFDSYKEENSKKEEKQAKTAAYKALLKSVGIADKRIEAVLKVSDLDKVALNEKGEIDNAGDLKKQIKDEWADFISGDGKGGTGE